MVWECHRCGQKNRAGYRRCKKCETKKYICPNCGSVDYNVEESEKLGVIQRLKWVVLGE